MAQGNQINVMTVIPTPLFFFHIILTGVREVGALYCFIGITIRNLKILLPVILLFTLLADIFPMKPPHIIYITEIFIPILIIAVSGSGGCFQIFSI